MFDLQDIFHLTKNSFNEASFSQEYFIPILKNKFSFYHSNTPFFFPYPPFLWRGGTHKSDQGFVLGDFVNIFAGIGIILQEDETIFHIGTKTRDQMESPLQEGVGEFFFEQ